MWAGNGKTYNAFTANIFMVNYENGQQGLSSIIGTWDTGFSGKLTFEKGKNLANFRAVTVYQVTTIIVCK